MKRVSLPKPTIAGLRLSALVDLYRWRLGAHKAQELLAGMGIAIGVALFFGVLVANTSLIGSAGQLIHAVNGSARFQLAARSSEGFNEALVKRVARLPGVRVAAPLLRENAAIIGPKGRDSIQLVGVTPSQVELGGAVTQDVSAGALVLARGVGLPSAVANDIGASAGRPVTLLTNGSAHSIQVRAIFGSQTVGAVANSPIVVALLARAQQITGKPGRVTEVLVKPTRGAARLVERELQRVAAGRLDVEPASNELAVLKATAKPTSQSTSLFAAISAMVVFLLALNAMLLTVPERRRFTAELRQQGFSPRQVLLILISQAVMLGLAASLVGVILGDVLSRSLFQEVPSYLTLAFPIGTNPTIPIATVLLAIGCGVVATVLASLLPVLDLRSGRAADAILHDTGEAGQSVSKRLTAAAGVTGIILLLAVTIVVLLVPSLSVVGGIALALAAFCLIFPIFLLVLGAIKPISERLPGSMLALAIVELDATATRSIALAGVAALAVYGMVAIQGARHDLINGLDAALVQYLNTADIWVTTDNNFLTINSFQDRGARAKIARSPDVTSAREYQGELLDVGTRRLWIRARPADDDALIQASQLLHGNLAQGTQEIRQGGWAAVSNGFAEERHLAVGDTFALPTPSGTARFRVAAITTNVGWPPGAITLNDNDYQHYWQSTNPTALEVNLKHGITPQAGKRAVEQALGHRPGLLVQTLGEREARYEASARQGITSLSQISTLLLIATSLAIAAALSAAIWQRRARLASLKAHGFDSSQLLRALLLESTILIGIGCLDGAILGIYAHALASRWLQVSVGFPAPFSLGAGVIFLTLAIIIGIALAVIALPGMIAARVPAHTSFQESL
jgi:putative ABC transport system permease protein